MKNTTTKIVCSLLVFMTFTGKVLAKREIDSQTITYAFTKMGKDDTGFLDCVKYNLNPDDVMSSDYTAKEFVKRINEVCYSEEVKFYNKCLSKTGLSKETCLGITGTIGPMEISLRDGNILKLGSDGHYHDNNG